MIIFSLASLIRNVNVLLDCGVRLPCDTLFFFFLHSTHVTPEQFLKLLRANALFIEWLACSLTAGPWLVESDWYMGNTSENISSFFGNASVWFSGYARNLPLRVSLAVKEARIHNALKSFIIPPPPKMSSCSPEIVHKCYCPVLLFNKHFVDFSKLQ